MIKFMIYINIGTFDNNPYVDRSVTAEQHAQSGLSFEGVPVFDTPIGKLIDFKPCWFKSFREHPVAFFT